MNITSSDVNHPIDNTFSKSTRMTNAAKGLLADIRELAAGIAARAAEIEADRRLPPDLVEALRSIGVFRMLVPRSHGGLDRDGRRRMRRHRSLAAARYL
jgi:alkylation response protein AidB-like acyl-CoA dehydrogenase